MKKRFFSLFVCTALLLSIVFSAHTAWADASSGEGDTYTDPLSGVTFVVPDGWSQVQSNVELAYPFQVQFTSQQNAASSFLYGSADVWSEMTASERSGHTRSDIDSAYIYAYEDGALIEYMAESIVGGAAEVQSNAEVEDIALVTYGKNEVIEFAISQEVFGVRVPLIGIVYVENGYMHLFLYAGTDGQATRDFHSVLSSLQAPAAKGSGSDGAGSGQPDELAEKIMEHLVNFLLFLVELGITFLIYALPFVVYRNAIRKRPVNEKALVLILVVLYEFVAWVLLNGAMSWFLRRYANIFIPFIWGWYSYRKMVRKKDTDDVPEDMGGAAAPQQPENADMPHSAAHTSPQTVSAAPARPADTGAPAARQPAAYIPAAAAPVSPAPSASQTPPAAPAVPSLSADAPFIPATSAPQTQPSPAAYTPAPAAAQTPPAAQRETSDSAALAASLWPTQYHSAQDMRVGSPKQRGKASVSTPVPATPFIPASPAQQTTTPAPQTPPSATTYISAPSAPSAPAAYVPTAAVSAAPAPQTPVSPAPQTPPPAPRVQFCRNCGFRLLDDSKFCSCCGTPVVPITKE